MSERDDDLLMADLLGEAPTTPDPSFRYDVLSRASIRSRRRAALNKALNQIAVFSAIGLIFPVAGAAGLTWEAAQPLVMAGGALAVGLVAASISILGPRAVLARSRTILTRA